MTVSRRNFLRKSTMIALVAALPLSLSTFTSGQQGGPPPVPPDAQRNPLYNFTRATFVPYVNSVFVVNSVPLSEIVLVEVKETPLVVDRRATRTPVGECFTLVFRGPNRTAFKQNTYTLDHAALGRFEIFLGPTDRPGSEQQYYTAVINRRQ